MSHRFSNRLVHESSPYLLQHAHNPVDWYPWGPEAFKKAKNDNKPVLVSIGYSSCHWCHVMERESFENEEVAAFMNENFICIKIDREERPDLDHIYMDAVQALSGAGGWPLHVFCDLDGKPFFGGTYFPPVRAYNRISWMELLQNISHAWRADRIAVESQADRLTHHISSLNQPVPGNSPVHSPDHAPAMARAIMNTADRDHGGFGTAPKFPHLSTIRFLLEYGFVTKDREILRHAEFSLLQLIRGGIYDHLGGGMFRYSTDERWHVPHFEKMLYDNAMLMRVLSDALLITSNREFQSALYQVRDFLLREMKHPDGGYYAALDADSEGSEGRFYVWEKTQVDEILQEDSELISKWFDILPEGNWEGQNILQKRHTPESFCREQGLDLSDLGLKIEKSSEKLMEARSMRPRPSTDNNILLGWNALLLSSFCKAYAATGDHCFKEHAIDLFTFLNKTFFDGQDIFHVTNGGKARIPAFADDLACWVEACIQLQEITSDQKFLLMAKEITGIMEKQYLLPTGYFSHTRIRQEDVLFPRPELYDGTLPSANALMAHNLHYLATVFSESNLEKRSVDMLAGLMDRIIRHPTDFSLWSLLVMYKNLKNTEIVIAGTDHEPALKLILGTFLPNRVIQTAAVNPNLPLFEGKSFDKQHNIYICIDKYCFQPIDDPDSAVEMLIKIKY